MSNLSNKVTGNGKIISKEIVSNKYMKIEILASIDVKLIKGEVGKITVETDENLHEYVVVESKNEKLIVKLKQNSSISTNYGIKVTIPFDNLTSLKSFGSSSIVATDTIESKVLTVSSIGSGSINISCNTESLNLVVSGSGSFNGEAITATNAIVTISGSGSASLSGKASKLTLTISGSGNFDGFNFISNVDIVNISGSGNANIVSLDSLEAVVVGSGNIRYKGDPVNLSINTFGSGSVNKM